MTCAHRRVAFLPSLLSLPILIGALVASGCGRSARLSVDEGTGPDPVLPPPSTSLLPVVRVAPAAGWSPGNQPVGAAGTSVVAMVRGLQHPRWLYVLPNGDVLVAETNAPPKPDDAKGLKGFFMKKAMKQAGSALPSANQITLLRDSNGDHVADVRTVFLSGLNSPFGMALVGPDLYVANTDALMRFRYEPNALGISAPGVKVTDLPAGTLNHHWAKNVIANSSGSRLYVSVGSNSNAGENGLDKETERAAIWEVDPATGQHRILASGLRNPVGMAWVPERNQLWVAVNERDELGSDLVPDYMTAVVDGAFYGFPFSYFGQHVDQRVKPPRPELVAQALVPSYALGPHTASLGLAWAEGSTLPPPFRSGMFVGQHGSWNRKPSSGYKVVFVPFVDGQPAGRPIDVLTGFLAAGGEAQGRPVGVAVDKTGTLLVADDVGNAVWSVSAAGSAPRAMGN